VYTVLLVVFLAGLLTCLHTILQPFAQPQQQQQQLVQQLAQQPSSMRPLVQPFRIVTSLGTMWFRTMARRVTPALVHPVLPLALPMLQQLQHCRLPMLPAAPSTSAAAAAASFSGVLHRALFKAQTIWAQMLFKLGWSAQHEPLLLPVEVADEVNQLLHEPVVLQLLLQLLTACIAVQQKIYSLQQQQQEARTAHDSSSSSSSSCRSG
jgi:hypothetical protein